MSCGDESGKPSLMGDHPAAKGLALLRSGDAQGALVWFDALVAQEPNGVPGHFLRVEALHHLGDLAAVRATLADLVKRFPFAEGACRERLALLALQENDRPAALVELERAVAAGWSNVEAITATPSGAALAGDPLFAALFERARANPAD
jgi:hypothetical protein